MLTISIVIPNRNGIFYVPLIARSLVSLDYEKERFEVIVVDNLSNDGSSNELVTCLRSKGLRVLSLECNDTPSSYAARNIGIQAAGGKILAFLDIDCCPQVDWLNQIEKEVESGKVIAGHIELEMQDFNNYWEQLDKAAHMRNDRSENSYSIATANMAILKEDFQKVGFFQEVTSGGDFQWSNSARRVGLGIKYCPNVVVFHPTRKSYDEISKKMVRISKGYAEICKKSLKQMLKGLLLTILKVPLLPRGVRIKRVNFFSYLHFRMQFTMIRIKQLVSYLMNLRP